MALLFVIGVITALILIMWLFGDPKPPKKKGRHR